MGAHKGTYNPDSHLHSTTRIPSSDPTGLHPRPTGGPFSEESYLSAWGCSRHILCPNRQGGPGRDQNDFHEVENTVM